MRVLNLILAFSNFPAVFCAYRLYHSKDIFSLMSLIFVTTFSFLSHLLQNDKHNLIGYYPVSKNTSYYLNKLDVLGVIILLIRIGMVYHNRYGFDLKFFEKHKKFTFLLLISGISNIISEKYPPIANDPSLFTLIHAFWHISIFSLLDYFLSVDCE